MKASGKLRINILPANRTSAAILHKYAPAAAIRLGPPGGKIALNVRKNNAGTVRLARINPKILRFGAKMLMTEASASFLVKIFNVLKIKGGSAVILL